ncbi:MAG: PfkB family carbohydrate kinase, partial [Pediococcus parvulus]|jgi:pyridoxine kinase
VTTPNLFEAGVLSGMGTLHNLDEMKQAAKKIHELGAKNVVVKGGKGLDSAEAVDVFYDGKAFETLSSTKQATDRNAGAGCTFAAAVVGGLANGLSVADAVHLAKKFDTAAIQNGFDLNKFLGPVFHPAYRMKTVGKLV